MEEIKVSIEKDFITDDLLNKAKKEVIKNISNSTMSNVSADFNQDMFEVSVSDVNDNVKTFSGKVSPSVINKIFSFVDEIFKGNINWDELDLDSDKISISTNLDFVDGRYLEKYDEANDKTIKIKYSIGHDDVSEDVDKLKEDDEIKEPTDVDLKNKEVIMESEPKSEITFVHHDLKNVLEGFKEFLEYNEMSFEQMGDGFIINTDDLQWMKNTLSGLTDLGIGYKIKHILPENSEHVDEPIIESTRLVAMDFEVTNKNEKFVVVFEERHEFAILSMVQDSREFSSEINFEYIPITEKDIVTEAGNRLFRDKATYTNIELINEKRFLL